MLQLLQRQIYVVMHSGLMRRFEYVAALVYQCLVLFIEELIGDSQQPEEEVLGVYVKGDGRLEKWGAGTVLAARIP